MATAARIALPKLLDLSAMQPETAALVTALNGFGTRRPGAVLASMYRHLAHWPSYLAFAWLLLAPMDGDGLLAAAIDQAQRAVQSHADGLLVRLIGRATPPPPALAAWISAAVEPFVGDVCRSGCSQGYDRDCACRVRKRGEVRDYGKIANTAAAVKAVAIKLTRGGSDLRFCYEAGPCGYGIQRQLTACGHECVVVAPSLIPRRPGDRIKTDRRDAINLAKLHRAGELTAVWVPDQTHEAIRDLVRARLAAVRNLRQARQQLSGFLLRHGHHYHRPAWTQMHRRWLAGLRFEHPVHHIVLEEYRCRRGGEARRDRLEAHIEAALPDWSLAPVVRALQALRGMALVVAATLIAELGDITRFANPRQLMAYLGLVPSEHSRAERDARAGSPRLATVPHGVC